LTKYVNQNFIENINQIKFIVFSGYNRDARPTLRWAEAARVFWDDCDLLNFFDQM